MLLTLHLITSENRPFIIIIIINREHIVGVKRYYLAEGTRNRGGWEIGQSSTREFKNRYYVIELLIQIYFCGTLQKTTKNMGDGIVMTQRQN